MSWETDFTTTLPEIEPAAIWSATLTVAERQRREHVRESLLMLGLHSEPGERKIRGVMRRTVNTDEVLRLYDAGHSPTAIGRMLGIQRSSVWHHINKGRR